MNLLYSVFSFNIFAEDLMDGLGTEETTPGVSIC